MGNTSPIVLSPNDTRIYNGDTVYLRKGYWRCKYSDTGAHKWLLDETDGYCSVCHVLYSEVYGKIEITLPEAWAFYLMTNWDDYWASYQQAKKRIIGGAE